MFLSSWLKSFKKTVRLAPRLSGSRLRRHRDPQKLQPIETLENRVLLVATFPFPINPGVPVSAVEISHSSSVTGEPNRSTLPLDRPRSLDPSEITLALVGNPALITARSNDPKIVQGLNTQISPNLKVYYEPGNPEAYIRFAAGPALFGQTTVTITVPDPTGIGPPQTLDIPVWLNDVPSVNPIDDISIPEDTPLVMIPLSGITAGGGADDPSNGGQRRLLYASSNKPFLTGIPAIQYSDNSDADTPKMEQLGSLAIRPVKGAPLTITALGDNEAVITVTIEDGGVDNLVGKRYDPTSGDVNTINYGETLDNIIRSQTFRIKILPVNDLPTIGVIQTAIIKLSAECTASDLTISSVNDASRFPPTASPTFTIQIDNERMRVTSVTSDTSVTKTIFSVTRGVDGTLVGSHAINARVTLIDDVVRFEDTLGPTVLDVDGLMIVDSQGRTVVNLKEITPGGGSSPIGNEQQTIQLASYAVPAQPITSGFYTLTFDNGVQPYTSDLVPHNAPTTTSLNEKLRLTTSANGGKFTLTLANNIGAVTSLEDDIPSALPGATSVFNVDNLFGFPQTTPFVIWVGSGILGTLQSSLTEVATTLTLTDAIALPTTPFTIQVEQEQMDVTAVAGSTLTVTRGTKGTTAAAHSGTPVNTIDVVGTIAEEMLVTNVASAPVTGNPSRMTLTVLRGHHGTAPSAHTNFASVIEIRTTNLNGTLGTLGTGTLSAAIDNRPTTTTFNVKAIPAHTYPAIPTALLTSSVTVLDTDIIVDDVAPFAAFVTPFKIQINGEVMLVTSVDTPNKKLIVQQRAIDGTTLAAHATSDTVLKPFTIRVNREEMRVTNVTGNTLTVVRGTNGIIAAHGLVVANQVDDLVTVVDASLLPLPISPSTTTEIRIDGEDMRVVERIGNQLLVIRGIHGTPIISHTDLARVSPLQTTGLISYNAKESEITGAIRALPLVGPNGVEVLGGPVGPISPVTFEFINHLGRVNLDNMTTDKSALTGNLVQNLFFSGKFTGTGTFTLTFNGQTTLPIPYNATATQVQAALELLPAINSGDIIVRGGDFPSNAVSIEFTGQFANTGITPGLSAITADSTLLVNDERQRIDIFGAPTGGGFLLQFGNLQTNVIAYDPKDPIGTAARIQSELRGLSSLSTVTVGVSLPTEPGASMSFLVTFTGSGDGDRDHPELQFQQRNGAGTLTGGSQPRGSVTTLEDGDRIVLINRNFVAANTNPSAPIVQTQAGALSIRDALEGLQSMTIADVKTSGGALPSTPVIVEFVGQYAGLDVNLLTINNSPLPLLGLFDFSAAASVPSSIHVFDGESQRITVQATSSNPDVVPNPTVVYTSPLQTAELLIINNTDEFGEADITITISDSGFDQDLNTLGDNGVITKTFHVRVRPTNDLPTIAPLPDLSRPKNSSPIPITLKGITTGGRETQDLRVTATATDLNGIPSNLLPDPSVVYSNGALTGTMTLVPAAGQVGTAMITVTVEDAGVDGVLNTTGDNGLRRVTFRFDVSELPTLGLTPSLITLLEDSVSVPLLQPLALAGITAGAGEASQPLQLTVSNLNTGLFTPANLNVAYTSPANTGTLNFTPTAQLSGTDTFRLTLVDAGPDGQLGTSGQLTADTPANSTLISVNNTGIFPTIPTDKLFSPVSLAATTVTLVSAAAFPLSATPTSPFNIQINNEVMSVIGVVGNTFTVVRAEKGTSAAVNDRVVQPFKIQIGSELLRVTKITGSNLNVVRGIDGTTAAAHLSQDLIVHPFALDNLTITRDIALLVNPVNDLPTLDVISPNPFAPGTLTIPEGSGEQIISLSGITDGEGAGARQHLQIIASTTNSALTGLITVVYNDGDPAGSIRFTPTANVSGAAGITVTVFDGGADNDFNTREANDTFSRTLNVNVVPIGDAPTINTIGNRTIDEDAPLQTVSLAGITDGDANAQDLRVTVSTTDTNLISNLTLNYNPLNLQPSHTPKTTPPSNGTLTFVPGANRFGSASITVTVTDGGADARLGIDTLVNAPTASLLSTSVVISDPTRFPAAPGFNIFIDSEEMTVNSIAGSTFTVTRAVNFTPLQAHAIGATVSAPNTVADNVSTSRTFNVTVNPVNDAPTITTINGTSVVAVSQVILPTIPEDAPLQTINLAGIGPGPFESQGVSVSVTSNNTGLIVPSVGYVNGASTGTITFQPDANKFGTATLTVRIQDAGPDGNLATPSDNAVTTRTIVVNVSAVNDAPTVDPVSAVTVSEDSGEKTVNLTGIKAGGGESQILKVTSALLSSSIAGLITNLSTLYTSQNSTGAFKFTPGTNLFGTATIRVTVEDAGFDGVMANAADNVTFFRDIVVNVTNVNDLPTLTQPPAATINKSGYLINSVTLNGISDADLNTQTLTVTATSDNPGLVPNPTVTFTQSGVSPSTALQTATLVFNPAANQLGTANITVTVSDGIGSSVIKTFLLTVADVNLPTTIDGLTDITGLTEPAATQFVTLTGITAGGIESQVLTVTATSSNTTAIPNPSVAYSSADPDGTLSFTPAQDAAGTFTITVTVTDASGNFTTRAFDVVIAQGDNDAPTLDPIANKVIAKSALPTLQTVNLAGISDGPFESGAVTVTVLSNDNQTLVPLLPSSSANYTSLDSTGTLTFTPAANTSGVANLIIRVQDLGGTGLTFDRPFSVFVVNPPTLANITNPAGILEDTVGTQSVPLSGISDGDFGTEGFQVSAVVLSDPSGIIGSLSTTFVNPTDATGSVEYTLAADRNGTATIQVTVKDRGPTADFNTGDEATVVKTFTVVVTPVNDAPTVTVPATLMLSEDGPTGTINLANILAKMGELLDEAGQPLRISAMSADTNKVTVSSVNYTSPQSTGSVVVAPVANAFGGPVNVTITVEDGGTDNNLSTPGDNQSFSKVVEVSITAANDLPTLNTIGDVTVNEDSGMGSVNLAGITAGAGESQGLTVTATSDNQFLIPDANLSVIYTSANPTGTLQFTPLADKFGDAFITVTVTDDTSIHGVAKSFSKTFKVHVNAVNDAPEIFALLATADSTVSLDGTTAFIDENLPVGTEVAVVDFDDEGPLSSLNVSIISGNTGNAFSISNDGTIRVANAAAMNFEANPTFTITVKITDNSPVSPTGLSAQQTFTISLTDLSEVLTIGSGNWPASGGLTIQRTGAMIQVLNSLNVDVVPAHVFANVSQIQVTGRSGTADVLTLDYSGSFDPIPGGTPGGLTFNGGAGAGDTLKFANATFGQLDTTFSSPTSAVINDPAAPISLTGIEAITFNSSVTATNLNFVYGPGNDVVTFADDGNSGNGVSTFSASSSPLVTFPTSAGVTVDVGDGNNSITFNSIEDAAGPAVTVLAGDGLDSLRASAVSRAVSLSGGGSNDTLAGGSGNDTLNGGDDDDTISGGMGDDQIFGGTGTNTLYESADASFTVSSGAITGLGNDTFSNIAFANLVGGPSANTISAAGFGGQATINGGGGNDNLTGSSQEDVITGGLGDDTIDGGGSDDTLIETGNFNFLLGASTMTGLGSDSHTSIEFALLTGGSGNNTLDASGFGGTVTLFGGAGNDILKGGAGNDSLSGDAGADTLSGNGGTNTLNGGTEIDQVFEMGNVDFTLEGTVLTAQLTSGLSTDDLIAIETAKLVGGDDNNRLNASMFSGKTTLQGGNGADTLIGGSNADSLEGGNGDDVLTGGLGNDKLVGGANLDTIVEDNLTGLTMTASSMTATSAAGSSTDTLASMEAGRFTGTATGNTLSGGTFAGALTIDGLEGNDTLTGGAGSDFIYGRAGKDRLSGGAGNDQIDGGTENDSIYGQAGNDVILGGEGNDSLSGGENDDAIDGQGGDDKVFGDNGNDILIGGTGKDSINGGAGSDKLWSGDYATDPDLPDDGEKDTLISGAGTDTVTGEVGLDVMTDASNTTAEKAAAFIIDYNSIFSALLGP